MKILKNKRDLETYIKGVKDKSLTIGFAPTMGALHGGHLSLYKQAKEENDVVISSIFVNPTQFNNPDDLQKYPRSVEKDIELLSSVGVDAVYVPSVEDLYPKGLESKKYDFDGLENEMEGKFRPGHFDGVGTVVEELFSQVKPDNAYFGEKDFQQLMIIKKLVEKKNIPVNVIGVPTFREDSGLAMSSRNLRLTQQQKSEALIIYRTLVQAKEWFGEIPTQEIYERVKNIFSESNLELEYFLIAEEDTLKEVENLKDDKNHRAFLVAFAGDVRLIDNMRLD